MYRLSWVSAFGLTVVACLTVPGCARHGWSSGAHSAGGLSVAYLGCDGRVYLVLASADFASGARPARRGRRG